MDHPAGFITREQKVLVAEHESALIEAYVTNHQAELPLDMEMVRQHVKECNACSKTLDSIMEALDRFVG